MIYHYDIDITRNDHYAIYFIKLSY